MIELKQDEWSLVEHLFDANKRNRCWIDATFNGYFDGTHDADLPPQIQVWVDDRDAPKLAQLKSDEFRLFAGDRQSPEVASICASMPPLGPVPPWNEDFTGALLLPEDDGWARAFRANVTRSTTTMRLKVYSSASLDVEHLESLVSTLPAGHELRRFDREMALRRGIKPDRARLAYVRLERFFDREGLSFWILKDGERVSEATSYGVTETAIDVGIGTEEGHEGKGLATVVGAALLLATIEAGKDPKWFTVENPRSDGLAQKLGYTLDDEFDLIGFRD